MRNRVLALLLMIFVPIAPAICEGSAPEPKAAVPPCHAHPAAAPDDLGADDDAQCCAACDAYVSGKLSSETLQQVALLVAPSQLQLRLPAWTSRASHTHLSPLDSSSAYLRQSSPLQI
ncbi:MAG: hypothetical protein IH800_06070 [Myxococcales bacterium]|nr:hypothetical protein [Myxococcales bacterium]MCZ6713685.1 hypothetical protein [Deltaproteobacteria bacterium]TDJ02177.1 MAG: hypothetical protein E2O73_02655 [Deltaproteobacteria bacterium]TDJ04246.1 MAG: hypothetical protein E2O71_13655 [Deltaproteobacteria bacterium]